MSDSQNNEQIELIAKELYVSFKDYADPKCWFGYPSWNNLGDASKGFWNEQVKIIYNKMKYIDNE